MGRKGSEEDIYGERKMGRVFHRQGGTSLWPYLQGQWEAQKEGAVPKESFSQEPQADRGHSCELCFQSDSHRH